MGGSNPRRPNRTGIGTKSLVQLLPFLLALCLVQSTISDPALAVPGLEVTQDGLDSSVINLNLQDAMRTLRRMKRMTKLSNKYTVRSNKPSRCENGRRRAAASHSHANSHISDSHEVSPNEQTVNGRQSRDDPVNIDKILRLDPNRRQSQPRGGRNDTGKCVISADQAVHYCGFTGEVTAPIIPPPQQGKCHVSQKSEREVCFPSYEDLDTTCTDPSPSDENSPGPVPPPVIKHATVRAMAFVAPDDLQRLIKQYYRQNQQPIPKDINYDLKPYLFARYKCDYGYELIDEIDTVFCSSRKWVQTMPRCQGKGPCAHGNGGCSHSCISPDNSTIECRCPKGLVLDADDKTCIKPAPKNECKNLQNCHCESISETQLSCTCRPSGEKCLLQKGPPKIYFHPAPPYQVEPGGNVNITCAGVGYPFPKTSWKAKSDHEFTEHQDPNVKRNSLLAVNEIVKNAQFICVSENEHGSTEKEVDIVVAGPDASRIEKLDPDRTSVDVHWEPPSHVNRPITHYTIYYTNNPQQPVKNWKSVDVNEPNRNFVIEDLRPDTDYTFRVRANDNLGPGKLSNAITTKTQEAAQRPAVEITEGEELRVSPGENFTLNCQVTRGDPTPQVVWESKGRKISNPQETRSITLSHKGLLEETSFLCVAENEAGKTSRRIHVIVTGPTEPERIRTKVEGDDVALNWEPPRITNGPIEDYEILYTDDPTKPEDQWDTTRSNGETSITIPDLRELTDYTFRIKGKNANGVGLASKDYNVTTWLKPRPPVITLKPESDIEAEPSTNELIVECESTGVPKPKITWFWNDNLISDGEDGFRVYDVSKMDVLNVTNSKLVSQSTTRTGKVRCESINNEGTDEKEINIKIKGPGSPPKDIATAPQENGFKVEWKEPNIPNGEVTGYDVYYSKNPDAPLAEWQKVSVPADKLNTVIGDREEDTPYVVRIQAVTDDGPGILSEPYEVTTGQKHIPLTVRLEVIDPSVVSGEETVVEPGQRIKFRCITEGRPTPTVSYNWLPSNNTETGQEPVHIRIEADESAEHTYKSDETESQTFTRGHLVCQARNPDGSVEDRATFVVKKPGSPPLSISPDVDVDNKVTIKWDAPTHPNGDLTGYKVYLSADPSKPLDQWQTFDVTNVDEPLIVFGRGELEPDTHYHVQVVAINNDGEGVKSDPLTFHTQSGAPIDSPTDVVSAIAPDNTVNVSWAGPSSPNGPIQAYTVYFTPADDGPNDDDYQQWNKIVVPSTDDAANITLDKDEHKIKPNTPYKTRITATNDQNEGPPSETHTFITGSGEIVPVISLSPSDNPAKVVPRGDYTVTCSATGIPDPDIYWIVDGQQTNNKVLQLSDLTKDSVVECHAVNNAGEAKEPLRIEVQGPGTPVVISSISALPDQEVALEWSPPTDPNGQITGYKIIYGSIPDGAQEPVEWHEQTVPDDQVQATIKGLDPKTTYTVKVQAISDRGPGVVSETARSKTLPLTPPPPQEAKVNVHNNNTVALEFDAVPDPETPETKIKNYKIHYTSDDPITEATEWKEMTWTHPDDSPTVSIPIDGDNFKPHTKYNIKITPEGEITGTSSDPLPFETGSGIIAPEKPTFNVDAPDNVIKVPAGTDYSVTCSSDGRPPPIIKWVDSEGNVVSEGPVFVAKDVKTTQNVKCVAENEGGKEEENFQIYVAGPGDAPEITNIHAHKPRTLEVRWDPPKIPNGEITRYIVYYTPLDDQDPSNQVGQVPSKPISEWLTHHVVGENLTDGEKEATIKDFINPDTSYAVVVQAVNDDGPGPYSVQQNVRTMSKAQEDPPTDLRVEPIDQRSAEVDWKPPENTEEKPIGYELYYVPANKEIEIDEFDSLPKWNKVSIDDGEATSHVLKNALEPNTEYVFKIRAIYPKGPGVFSEPCITKTLPEGFPPTITVSSGGEGTEGATKIDLLPGSSLVVFCNATGSPSPSVNWIRQGATPIDPSTVKNEDTATRWSLNVANVTEDAIFNCVAQNSLGSANWTIELNVVDDLPPNWKNELVKAKQDDDQVLLVVDDKVSDNLKDPNQWKVRFTDDPSKPREEWTTIDSDGRALNNINIADTTPGKTYFVTVTDPTTGLESPLLSFRTPKPPTVLNIGTNIDDDIVVDFSPAVGPSEVENYEVNAWPVNDPSNIKSITVPVDKTTGNVIEDLAPDTDYSVQVVTNFKDGSKANSDVVPTKTKPQDIKCDCSHACRLVKDENGKSKAECYCPEGYELNDDAKTCKKIAGTETENIVVEVTPTYEDRTKDDRVHELGHTEIDGSPLPTSEDGRPHLGPEDVTDEPLPTDSLGRVIRPIVRVDGSRLPLDSDGNTLNQLGQVIERNDAAQPLDGDGNVLTKNLNGDWVYPEVDSHGHPLPLDKNGKPVYPIIGSDGNTLPTNEDGQRTDKDGTPIPTNNYGKPIGPDGSPLPTDAEKNYRWHDVVDDITDEPLPTDSMGHIVYPIVDGNGNLLEKNDDDHYVDENGVEIPTNEHGFPVHPQTADVLPKNDKDQYVLSTGKDKTPTPETEEQQKGEGREVLAPVYDSNGYLLPKDEDGEFLDRNGNIIARDSLGRPLDRDGQLLPTNEDGNYYFPDATPPPTEAPVPTSESEEQQTEAPTPTEHPIVDANGYPLPKDEHGRYVDARGEPFRYDDNGKPLDPDGQPLPTDANGNYISSPDVKPTTANGDPVSVVNPDGSPVATDSSNRPLDAQGNPLLIRDGQFVDQNGNPLPLDRHGNALLLPTDSTGKSLYPVYDSRGNLLSTDSSGNFIGEDGQLIPSDSEGKPLGPDGQVLPTDATGRFVHTKVRPTDASGKQVTPVGPDGLPLATDNSGNYVKPDGSLVPINENNEYVDANGHPLPIDPYGRVVIRPDEEPTPAPTEGVQLPTDASGNKITIVDEDGQPLPTNDDRFFLHKDGSPVPTNIDNQYVDVDGTPLPVDDQGKILIAGVDDSTETVVATDEYGKIIHPIVDSDGQPLPKDDSGRHLKKNGEPIPLNDFGKPLDKDGNVLPKNDNGEYILADDAPPKPTDPSGHPVLVLGPDGRPAQTDKDGNVVGPDGQPLAIKDGSYVDADGSPLPTDGQNNVIVAKADSSGLPIYPIADEEGNLLPTDSTGRHILPDGTPVNIDDEGKPIGPDGQPLERNQDGRYVVAQVEPSTTTAPIIVLGPDNQPLATDSTGRFVDSSGTQIQVDSEGRPVDTHGDVLPKDSEGNYVLTSGPDRQPTATELPTEPAGPAKPTDGAGNQIVVVNSDGIPLPTDASGNYVDTQGNPIQINDENQYVGPDSSPLPTNEYGNVVLPSKEDVSPKTLPTDDNGRVVEPVVGPDGELLPTDSTGRHVAPSGENIPINEYGKPTKPDGTPLEQNDQGQYVYKVQAKPTDSSGNPIIVVGPDGQPLTKNDEGHYVGSDGEPVPTNSANEYVGPDGSPLPTSSDGHVIFGSELPEGRTLPTDESGREVHPVVDQDGKVQPTDSSGRHVDAQGIQIPIDEFGRPVDETGHVLPRNHLGNFVYTEVVTTAAPADKTPATAKKTPVVYGPDGNLLEVNEEGNVIAPDGSTLQVNAEDEVVDADGIPLPTDFSGHQIYKDPELTVTDVPVRKHPVVGTDGQLLPTDSSGNHLDKDQQPLTIDSQGRPLKADGSLLPTNQQGYFVYNPDTKPTDASGRTIVVVGSDGQPLPTDSAGNYVGKDEQPIQTNDDNQYVDADGNLLPVNEHGNVVIQDATPQTLPTDGEITRVPVVGPDGSLLPTDATGRHIKADGELVPVDDSGRPVDADGNLLPQNEQGEYVHKGDEVLQTTVKPKPTDQSGQPAVIVNSDGYPLPTDSAGNYLMEDGSLVPINADNQYVGPDGTPLPYNPEGQLVLQSEEDQTLKPIPTDDQGREVKPIVNPKGTLLPTDSTGRHVDHKGEQIPIDDFGRPIDVDGTPLPQNDAGEYVYKPNIPPTDSSGNPIVVVGPDSKPLAKDNKGKYLDSQGEPVPTNIDNEYVGLDGSPLPTTSDGAVIYGADQAPEAKTLPTDDSGMVIYPIAKPDGSLYSTDATHRYVDDHGEPIAHDEFGRPIGSDGQVLPTDAIGNYMFAKDQVPEGITPSTDAARGPDGLPVATELPTEAASGKPTDASGIAIVVVNSDGIPLPTDASGNYVDPQGNPIQINDENQYVGPDSSPLPTNEYGNVILSSVDDVTPKTLPTDDSGRVVEPIVGPDGHLLPTDSSGRHVAPNGELILINEYGKPTKPDGTPLEQNDQGQYVYKIEAKPTDSSGNPIIVVGPDGQPLTKNNEGHYVDADGQPVPTNTVNEYVGPDGSPLPTSSDGHVIFNAELQPEGKTLPTDDTGKEVHPVINKDGRLLPTDSTGRHIKADGTPVDVNEFGKPLGPDGNVLPTNDQEQYIYPEKNPKPTASNGKPIVVVGNDGLPLETNSDGHFIGPDGTLIGTNTDNQYVDKDGNPLPTTSSGQAVYSPDGEPKTLPTDSTNQVIYPIVDPDGQPLQTDSDNHYVDANGTPVVLDEFGRPLNPDGQVLPKNEHGQYVYPVTKPLSPTDSYGKPISVIGKDGLPLSTDDEGRFVGPDGTPLTVNKNNQYIDANGDPLPTNEYGQAVYESSPDARPLPSDPSGRVIYPIVSSDGLPLPTDYTGHFTDDRGEIIPLDDYGRPLSPDGHVLPQNEQGQYVHGEDKITPKKATPTDSSGNPIVVVNNQGSALPTDSDGIHLNEDGSPVPTNSEGQYVGPDGSPLPFDADGRAVVDAVTAPEGHTLPTDDAGKVVYPVVGPDGSLLPTDDSGRHVDLRGEQIPVNEFGKPINRNSDQVLPTDDAGNYIFEDGRPTDATGKLIPVVNKDGVLLATDSTGNYVLEDNSPVPTNGQFQYIGPDGHPLPVDDQNRAVHPSGGEKETVLPTDESGKFIYPVVKPDGSPLDKDASGRHLDDNGQLIPIDDFGRPLNKNGQLLPKKEDDTYVYSGDVILPTDPSGILVRVVDTDGQPLYTDPTGRYLDAQGQPLVINSDGYYLGVDRTPLPIDDKGVAVYNAGASPDGQTLPTDGANKALPVVDENGSLRPTDESGYYLDLNGIPLDIDEHGQPHYSDGSELKQDDHGNYIFEDKRKKDREHCFVENFIEVLLVVDTSENVKILDYRLMKEAIKSFLKENFDLRENKVRLGLIKYGSEVDVPIALGDYSNAGELLSKIGDARRLKGSPQLGEALRDAVSEFSISGSSHSPKVAIVFKGGKAADDVELPSQALRDESKATVFLVSVSKEHDDDDLKIVGDDESKILRFNDWKSVEPSALSPLADLICKAVPQDPSSESVWPARSPKTTSAPGEKRECSIVEYEVDLLVVLDSSKLTPEEFDTSLEGIGTLVDESFDLAPDVVRVGFIVYSDKVSVPVALGHYEDKIHLLEKIDQSEQLNGTAIASKGLDAAKQQFKLHGRDGVAKVVLLITNGQYRGNGQQFAQELRDTHDIQLFVLGINPSQDRIPSLQRLVGVEFAKERLITIDNIEDISNKLNFIRSSLCGRITQTTVSGDYDSDTHRTTKRDVTKIPLGVTKGVDEKEPCDDDAKMSVNIVIDSNGGDHNPEELNDVKHVVQSFLEDYYAKKGNDEDKPAINLMNIDSEHHKVINSKTDVPVEKLYNEMENIFEKAEEENLKIRAEKPPCDD